VRNPDMTNMVRGIIEPTPLEVEELLILKDKIKSSGGTRQEFNRKAKYLLAGLPMSYWDIEWKDFEGSREAFDFAKAYCDNISKALEQGQGIIFSGPHGAGKTTLSCLIGKTAIDKGYSVRYISIAKIIDLIMDSFEVKANKNRLDIMIERVEFLILDDLGKEYKGVRGQLNPMMTLKLDSLLRERINRNLVTIGTTNYPLNAIKEQYGESVMSVLSGSCKLFEIKGVDYRPIRSFNFWKGIK